MKLNSKRKAGETIIFDLAAKSIGSKANAALNLFDEQGGAAGLEQWF